MTFLEALATDKPMRRRQHVLTDIPEWKWYVLHPSDHDWLSYDASEEHDDDEDGPRTSWEGMSGFSREDMLAADWEVLG